MVHADALQVAQKLVQQFAPYCERIEIKGGLCRGKPEVHDIDLCAIPLGERIPAGLFGEETTIYPIQAVIRDGIKSGDWVKVKGADRLVQLRLLDPMIDVDLNLVLPPAQWGVKVTLASGPADFNHWIVTQRRSGGCLPSYATMKDGCIYVGGRLVPMPEEIDFLNFLGLGWLDPANRSPR